MSGNWKSIFNVSEIKDDVVNYIKHIKKNPTRSIRIYATLLGVVGCAYIVWLALQPRLIFENNTATGGDMGAHVWWPKYMMDVLLPSGRIFGWTMDYYAGFPVGQYYFPIPALMVGIFDIFLPYNVAFKLVTVLGSVFLPVSAYVLGRSVKAPRPAPLFMAFATTAFLFFTGDPRGTQTGLTSTLVNYENANFNHHIMGGPLLSNMAGEFSFSIALCFSFLFLAAFAVSLREGKRRWLVAVLLFLTILSHLVVAIFAFFAAVVFWAANYLAKGKDYKYIGAALFAWIVVLAFSMGAVGRYFFDSETSASLVVIAFSTLAVVATCVWMYFHKQRALVQVCKDVFPLVVGLMLSSIWLLPLFSRFVYTSNMRYEKLTDLANTVGVNELYELYISPRYFILPVFVPAIAGFIISAALLRKSIVPILTTGIVMAVVFYQWPEGHAWNLRFLPFWYLFIFMTAAIGYAEIVRLPSLFLSKYSLKESFEGNRPLFIKYSAILHTALTVVLVMFFFVALIGVGNSASDRGMIRDRRGFANLWAKYNFEGYEGKPAWPEFKNLIDVMDKQQPGRALWETAEGSYGTTLALMLLPYFTNHKISSMEGLYYEAAGTTAYHFLNVAEVSKSPSNPMRWPRCETNQDGSKVDKDCFDSYYGNLSNFELGVTHMQMMGVRYYLAHSSEAIEAANKEPRLKLLANVADRDGASPLGWHIYKVENSHLVDPLPVNPVVVSDKKAPEYWQQSGNKWLYDWWQSPNKYPVFTNGGPKDWKRKTAKEALANKQDLSEKKSDVKVSDIQLGNDSISFKVNKIGEPVLVKVSYYPTFKAQGAKEIYRASPNFMVVVPDSKNVTIAIKRDKVEWFSILVFFLGIGLTISMTGWGYKKFQQLSGLGSAKR